MRSERSQICKIPDSPVKVKAILQKFMAVVRKHNFKRLEFGLK